MSTFQELSFYDPLRDGVGVARSALLDASDRSKEIELKPGNEATNNAEREAEGKIRQVFDQWAAPKGIVLNHRGEELGHEDRGGRYTVVSDPRDGSTNGEELLNNGLWTISIGIIDHELSEEGVAIEGIVWAPEYRAEEQFFYGNRKIAYQNGTPIEHDSDVMSGKLVLYIDRHPRSLDNPQEAEIILSYLSTYELSQIWTQRRIGCGSLATCLVASGKGYGFIGWGQEIYDLAGAIPIAEGAGRGLRGLDGNEWKEGEMVVGGSPEVRKELTEILLEGQEHWGEVRPHFEATRR